MRGPGLLLERALRPLLATPYTPGPSSASILFICFSPTCPCLAFSPGAGRWHGDSFQQKPAPGAGPPSGPLCPLETHSWKAGVCERSKDMYAYHVPEGEG